jgi:hypothetical protein
LPLLRGDGLRFCLHGHHTESNEAFPKAKRGGSLEAIVDAAQRPFLKRGFGSVSKVEAASVTRRMLYHAVG